MNPKLLNPGVSDLTDIGYPSDIPENVARLHLMENPYEFPAELQVIIDQKLQSLSLNRYPDPNMLGLKKKLRNTFDIPDSADIILGNGSFEVLQNLMLTLHNAEQCFLAYKPSFFFFPRFAQILNQKIIGTPWGSDMLAAIKLHQPSLIIIDNPNNPMGKLIDKGRLETIIQAAPGYVLIDEAYCHYSQSTMMPYLDKYPNLIISRSLSKTGLAGLRFGFLCCHSDLAKQIQKVMLPFNINVYTACVIETLLDHFNILAEQTKCVIKDRNGLLGQMKDLIGDNVVESDTNFINFKIPDWKAATVFQEFIKNDILLFYYRAQPPHPLANHLRVTVGTPEENAKFLDVLATLK